MEKITRESAKSLGLKKFFTGEPCSFGHTSERYTANGRCTQCQREYSSNRYAQNKEDILKKARASYKKDSEKFKARVRERNARIKAELENK